MSGGYSINPEATIAESCCMVRIVIFSIVHFLFTQQAVEVISPGRTGLARVAPCWIGHLRNTHVKRRGGGRVASPHFLNYDVPHSAEK